VFSALLRAVSSRYVGLVACIGVIVLGVALMATVVQASRAEAAFRARIAALTRQAEEAAYWRARLSSCELAAAEGRKVAETGLSAKERARRLAQNEPAGFDVCARMESADQAVLGTLK
jgi:uncharacterized membrane-anchored protein